MINIILDEAINAYIVTIQDIKEGHTHKEIAERKIDALKIIGDYVKKETMKEVNFITGGIYEHQTEM